MQRLYKVGVGSAAVEGADFPGSEAEGCLGPTPHTHIRSTLLLSLGVFHKAGNTPERYMNEIMAFLSDWKDISELQETKK